jgi:leucyl/phenylalanyl-tRNA--protein transferase
MFYGESMFARVSDASKVALAYLVAFLRSDGVRMLDCQQETGHLASLGAARFRARQFSSTICAQAIANRPSNAGKSRHR